MSGNCDQPSLCIFFVNPSMQYNKALKEIMHFSHLLKSSWGTRAIGLNSNGTTSHIFTRFAVNNNCLNNIQI